MQSQQLEKARTCRSLGLLNRKQRNPTAAAAYFRQAAHLDSGDHISLVNLAELFQENKDKKHAIEYYMRAVVAAPQELAYQKKFLELAMVTVFEDHHTVLQQALRICLETPETECLPRYKIWHRTLTLNPAFSAIYKTERKGKEDVFDKKYFDRAGDYSALLDPYFLALLKRLVITRVPAFESFLLHLRRRLLEDATAEKKMFPDEHGIVALSAALSCYCLETDYIFHIEKEERQRLEGLRRRLEAGAASEGEIAIYACYLPLYTVKNAAKFAVFPFRFAEMANVARAQIGDYLALQETRNSIVALTKIDDPVSVKVREQYEEFPYPRWKKLPDVLYFQDKKDALKREGIKLLVAGCGTGQDPLSLAREFPQAEILAVDLSRSSLAYAIRKAAEYNMTNIKFAQADILHLESTGLKFDCIFSAGVLHHMADPLKGWKVLCNLLKPDGFMRIALYSEHGRRDIATAREVIARENCAADADSMRQFRRKSPHLFDANTLARLQEFTDYYSLPMYRDLIFHVQEERIDIPALGRRLKELGLVFDGFSLAEIEVATRYAAMFPDDKEAHSLDRWDALEKKYPDTFRNMYQFWCRKG